MEKAINDRPEVDEFRFELYDHLGIDQTQIDERDFIHEMAHNLYNKAHMKGSGFAEDARGVSELKHLVRLRDDYKRRHNTITAELNDLAADGTNEDKHRRLTIKRATFRTFLAELENSIKDCAT